MDAPVSTVSTDVTSRSVEADYWRVEAESHVGSQA